MLLVVNDHMAVTVCEAPATTVTTTKDDLMHYLKMMYTMRRMEITCDTEYKVYTHTHIYMYIRQQHAIFSLNKKYPRQPNPYMLLNENVK